MRATAEQQISAFLANRPGVVARLCDALAERNVNIRAVTVLDTVDIGTVRLIVDNLELARQVLDNAGAAYVDVPVIAITMPNTSGGFARVARTLAAANINIEYAYATCVPGSEVSLGIFRVSDQEGALEIDFDVNVDEPELAAARM